MRRNRPMLAPLSALTLALSLTACGSAPLTETRLIEVPPPRPLTACAPEPAPPATNADAAVGDYIAALWDAGADCRTRLACVRAWGAGALDAACRQLIEATE